MSMYFKVSYQHFRVVYYFVRKNNDQVYNTVHLVFFCFNFSISFGFVIYHFIDIIIHL